MRVCTKANIGVAPSQAPLDRRQAALGGGGGQPTTQQSLESISGYTPPPSSSTPTPSNFKQGSILSTSDIAGYADAKKLTSAAMLATTPLPYLAAAVAVIAGAILF